MDRIFSAYWDVSKEAIRYITLCPELRIQRCVPVPIGGERQSSECPSLRSAVDAAVGDVCGVLLRAISYELSSVASSVRAERRHPHRLSTSLRLVAALLSHSELVSLYLQREVSPTSVSSPTRARSHGCWVGTHWGRTSLLHCELDGPSAQRDGHSTPLHSPLRTSEGEGRADGKRHRRPH